MLGDFLDLSTALRGGHDENLRGLTVEEDRSIQLGSNVCAGGHQDGADVHAVGARLLGDEGVAEHAECCSLDLIHAPAELNATLAVDGRAREHLLDRLSGGNLLETTLASTTCVDLSLDDPEVPAKLLCGGDGTVDRLRCDSGGNRNAAALEQLLGLIFVELHLFLLLKPEQKPPAALGCRGL